MKKEKYSVNIKISNLTLAQSIAIEDFLATWQSLGSLGSSRWTSFFADGDGNFRPKILYNGVKPRHTSILTKDEIWEHSDYKIDFDTIAWKLRDLPNTRKREIKHLKRHWLINWLLYKFKRKKK